MISVMEIIEMDQMRLDGSVLFLAISDQYEYSCKSLLLNFVRHANWYIRPFKHLL